MLTDTASMRMEQACQMMYTHHTWAVMQANVLVIMLRDRIVQVV